MAERGMAKEGGPPAPAGAGSISAPKLAGEAADEVFEEDPEEAIDPATGFPAKTPERKALEEKLLWLGNLTVDRMNSKRPLTEKERQRVHELYDHEEGDVKIMALGMIMDSEDIDKWNGELDGLIQSRDTGDMDFIAAVLDRFLKKGSRKERIMLTSKPGIPEWLAAYRAYWESHQITGTKLGEMEAGIEKYAGQPLPDAREPLKGKAGGESGGSRSAAPPVMADAEAKAGAEARASRQRLWVIGGIAVLAVAVFALRRQAGK